MGSSSAVEKSISNVSQNPMLNYVILKQIAKFCGFKVLSSHRLISKLWYDASLTSWLETAPPMTLSLTPPNPYEYLTTPLSVDIFTFLNRFHNEEERPCQEDLVEYRHKGVRRWNRFKLYDLGGDGPFPEHKYLPTFWSKCGQWITDLQIEIVCQSLQTLEDVLFSGYMPNLRSLRTHLSFSTHLFPTMSEDDDANQEIILLPQREHWKLKSLDVILMEDHSRNDRLRSPIQWDQVLRRYPNLEELNLWTNSYWEDFPEMLTCLRNIRVGNRDILKLKMLDLRTNSDEPPPVTRRIGWALFRLWRDAAFSLTLCTLHFRRMTTADPDFLKNALSFQATSVQYLHVGTSFRHSVQQPPLPAAKPIQTLVLGQRDALPFESPSFVSSSFPNLTYLKVEEDQLVVIIAASVRRGNKIAPGLVMQSLKGFHCVESSPRVPFKRAHILKLRKLMPNLIWLKMWLTNETFRAVVRRWPRLEYLHVYGDELDDRGITGNKGQRGRNARHNLTHLKKLEILCMTPEREVSFEFRGIEPDYQPPSKITGRSVVGGFLKLPNLQMLSLFVTTMEPYLIQAMKEKIPHVEVRVQQRHHHHYYY